MIKLVFQTIIQKQQMQQVHGYSEVRQVYTVPRRMLSKYNQLMTRNSNYILANHTRFSRKILELKTLNLVCQKLANTTGFLKESNSLLFFEIYLQEMRVCSITTLAHVSLYVDLCKVVYLALLRSLCNSLACCCMCDTLLYEYTNLPTPGLNHPRSGTN